MTTLGHLADSVRAACADPEGLRILLLAAVSLLQAAAGIGRSRQWYALAVIFGLTALAGFLLNPVADATTAFDVKAALKGPEMLTLLCIVQFVLGALALVFGLRLLEPGRKSASAL